MTRATVDDSTVALGQTLRTGRPLVGGFIPPWRFGAVHESLAHRLPGGIQAQSI